MTRSARVRSAIRLLTITVLALALGAPLAGCSGTTAGQAVPPTAPANVAPPTVEVTEPVGGATVAAGDLPVKVDTKNLKFVMPSNALVPGEGHLHVTLDDRPFVMSDKPEALLKDVGPGSHTLLVELVQNNTQSFEPPVKQTIEFTAE